jgi:transposase
VVAASDRASICFSLSPGNKHDAPCGEELIKSVSMPETVTHCAMDKAYEGDKMRSAVSGLGLIPVVPPKSNRVIQWEYDKEFCKKRNEVERFFLRIKRYRRVATRYDKLDFMFMGYLTFAMIVEALRVY